MDLRYYLSIFVRRLPYFLVVATVISAAAITVAMTLPPAYESQAQIIVESPQIPEELAQSTVRTPPIEQLKILEQKLLTRANLLDIARNLEVLPNLDQMNADEIVNAMRARTTILAPRGRNPVPLMTMIFEAPAPRTAAAVLNEYLILVQQEDAEFRRGRAGETLDFFEQEVERLGAEVEAQSVQILEYKQANSEALPDSLEFRMTQLARLEDESKQLSRDITTLEDRRSRLLSVFEQTGGTTEPTQQSTVEPDSDEQRLADLKRALQDALALYKPENPRVRLIELRISQLEETIAQKSQLVSANPEDGDDPAQPERSTQQIMFDFQIDDIDTQIETLTVQLSTTNQRIQLLSESIQSTPAVSIALEELERRFSTLQAQYQDAEARLSAARIGDVIESRSRGQRISVIEQPSVPAAPTKPNRMLIAGGGTAFGILAGLALIALLEVFNTTVRRPEDLVARFGITPFTTIPYIRTRGQTIRQRSVKLMTILAILISVPAAVYALHTFYLPLDLVADRIMDRIGVRW